MTDIVERLRRWVGGTLPDGAHLVMYEAADTIEQLRLEIGKLSEFRAMVMRELEFDEFKA